MNAAIYINEREPGLIPWGYFQVMLPGIISGLEVIEDDIKQEIFSEWLCELSIDRLGSQEFNFIVSKLSEYVSELPESSLSKGFINFWNNELAAVITGDARYNTGFTYLTRRE